MSFSNTFRSSYKMAFFLVIALSLLQVSTSQATCGKRPAGARIMGGQTAAPNSWPWQLSLREKGGKHYCGASLISSEWAVTAAHCVKDPTAQLEVMVGGHHRKNSDSRGKMVDVSYFIVHEEYKRKKHDVALLKLSSPVHFSSSVDTVCLPQQGQRISPGKRCYITGWGWARGFPRYLQQANVPIVSHKECLKKISYPVIDEASMLCVGAEGSSACFGDSGGPLVCEEGGVWILRGDASFVTGQSCPGDVPAVYARTSSYIDWIISKTGIGSHTLPSKVPGSRPTTTAPSAIPSNPPVTESCADTRNNCPGLVMFCQLKFMRESCKKTCNLC